ncbi:MAG: glycerophosphodiester phosphodiesterase, partial [Minisyncoccia bacterium]
WSAGPNENTLVSFQKSYDAHLDGVEFDVRFDRDGKTVVLSHDKVTVDDVLTLEEALRFFATTKLKLLIEFKEYSDDFFNEVVRLVGMHQLLDRVTIFGFPETAKHFPWSTEREVKLGIIAPYPHNLKNYILAHNPDMILLGWGNKTERMMFKIVWTVLSLANSFAKYPHVKFIIGVTYSEKDKAWLSRQNGLYGTILDMPLS